MRSYLLTFAAALLLMPLGAHGADLVVWWEKGFYPQQDEAVAEIIVAFEQKTGKQVELVQYSIDESDKALADVHRVATDGISAEQAVDEAIARIREILAE